MVLKAKEERDGPFKRGKKEMGRSRVQSAVHTHSHTVSGCTYYIARGGCIAGGRFRPLFLFNEAEREASWNGEERRGSISGDEEAPKHRLATREFSIFHRHAMPLQCTFISYGIRDVCTVYIVYIVH